MVLKALRMAKSKRNGKAPNPSAAIVDSQSIKVTEVSAGRDGHEAHRKATMPTNTSRTEGVSPGGHPRVAALGLCHPDRRSGPGEGTLLVSGTEVHGVTPEKDLG